MLRTLMEELPRLGLQHVPSEANFVMLPLESREAAARLVEELLMRGVIIRPLAGFGLPDSVRISSGTEDEVHMLLDALAKRTK